MEMLSLIANLLPVTIAGLVLGAGMPALFALAMRISAGSTETRPDGTVVQTAPASPVLRAISGAIFALIAAIILLGILWIAKDFIYHTTGFDLLGAAKK
ncbi:hypothetical protein [Rothia kristinae]|uniref:Uncharacterized protein n=1 Tax=Rothia kristinae TaxID=37923 RepID=A0A147E7P1_9MICC|nr:hypothetical protein [Rothia kristinae]TDP53598.1 hypothetical protein DEU33_1697 [Kocuria sp. AG109]SIM70739.1 transmembrane protein [Mycobacteroides abscessus subsp. abscessus]KTR37586.1 hypothetical protein RSA5_07355 [Rothia kristinae]KTR58157.1 hypothetical protein SA11R_06195 [Rothia kristinae]KTR67540.1 hypothetical protein SA12R_05995 [Rothia kristinae]